MATSLQTCAYEPNKRKRLLLDGSTSGGPGLILPGPDGGCLISDEEVTRHKKQAAEEAAKANAKAAAAEPK